MERPQGQRHVCEECGAEMAERRAIMHGHVIYLTACPRCTEDPLALLQGD